MAYQDLSFSAGETLTATKMNQLASNDKALRDGTGIAPGAITADKIDFATFEQDGDTENGYYKLGNLLFCWGQTTLTIDMAPNSESSHRFTFPKAFSTTPTIMVSNGDLSNVCGEYTLVNQRSATQCQVIGGHVGTATSNKMVVSYLAIGIAAS